MESTSKISVFEAICVLLLISIMHSLLTIPKIIIENQGSSSLINIIYVTIIAIFFIFILNILYKNFKGMDILDISNYLFGKWFKFIVGIFYIAYFIFASSFILRNSVENLKAVYFQSTPIPYILFIVLIGAGYVNKFSLKSVIKCNLVVVILAISSLVILFLLTMNNFVPQRIFPVLGYGVKNIFVDGISNIFIFSNIIFLFLLMPMLKNYNNFKKISYIGVLITGIFILWGVTALLFLYPSEIITVSNSPAYLQAKRVTLSKFVQRADAFFIMIWIIVLFSFLSIVLAFINVIVSKITNITDKSTISYIFIAFLFASSILYSNSIQIGIVNTLIYKNLAIIFVFGLNFLILLLGNIKKKLKGEN